MPLRALRPLLALADGSYVDRRACDAAFARMHARDARGDRVHLALACLALFLLAGPVTLVELAWAPLIVFFFLRARHAGGTWIHGLGQPSVLAAGALAAWLGVTLLWSPDRAQGLDEIGRLRWFLLTPLVFPAIEHRPRLVLALALGLIAASVAQLLSGLPGLRPPFPFRHPGRVSGWWQPVVAGSVQTGAVGLFLPAALAGDGRARAVGLVGLTLALAGLLASGTRGAWVSAAVFLLIAVPLVLWRADRRTRRGAVALAAAAAVVLLGAGLAMREGLAVRVWQARAELAAARAGDLDTPTGARIAVMATALETGLARPLGGLGVGSTGPMMVGRFGPGHAGAGMDHAHSTPPHLFGSAGLPGLALGAWLCFVIVRNGARAAPAEPGRALERGLPYAAGAMACAGLFDAVLINTQTCALIGAVAALSPAYRPGPDARPDATPGP